MTALLELNNVSKRFGGLLAVDGVSFSLKERSITALVGPNGAGKTTCFNMIAGAFRPTAGTIRFEGETISGRGAEAVCRLGIGRTFQIVRPMRDMTVLENAMVGAFSWTRKVSEAREAALDTLETVGLAPKANASISQLTLPDRKMLETAKALSTRPRLLLLDEVMAGLRPTEAAAVVRVLRRLVERGLTIMLVEHVMRIVMEAAENVVVLHHGAKIAEGAPVYIVKHPEVLAGYLGDGFRG
ncbi:MULTISPECIES: ABC transporter ATP-binding protein [Bradyrhizobium]|jgi:branched-chain amino acid transport system ATP-binding protein|uniref:ABC transporter ATP-binding protein n=1 Tax=Bradyrhizobium TaxID=374 RepID=UPI000486C317|nr:MULTISPECIES: ABC transporter ATP-binding protein [Bradyrhizobium]MCA1396211.1 ABC transporter ATP-binding protein [Bradyrhizobium sp. BRP56]MCS3447232.1 branched-chain amino acid transport system ATP-binding protein [Bradyrhizobium elkanii]MCS3561631.1 branched-chain amino acid transport system ATP-binding protein [Bradyrhizobium elkanii]MCW2148528.1 branched-chain amino acid transport system ATP-binding protein [Bradyrhizobium elkanii]MCW2352385.1 branched-chain amino acid transport syste